MAGIRDFKKVAGADEDVAKLQDRLQEFFAQFIGNPLLNGVLLTNVSLSSTATNVEHKLGRPHLGWIIVRKDANADIWESDTTKSFVKLTADANVTVDLWVF